MFWPELWHDKSDILEDYIAAVKMIDSGWE